MTTVLAMRRGRVWRALLVIGAMAGCNTREDDSASRASTRQAAAEAPAETTDNPLGVSAMQRAQESARAAHDAKDWPRCSEEFLAIAKLGRDDDGAQQAWLLVQHADADLAFQKDCLARLERAVAAGDASPADLAYLHDRVAVGEKRKQRYGTQYGPPIEDEANVDARRAAVGLGTLAEYQAEIEAMYGSKGLQETAN